ncbi:hypothetical protein ZOSMA_39G00010 [Zostera marina]|uniref:Caffeoyl-CoA O-methyltransferase n=1 Tax=Zostera marina TaxID=29655 RepID=A0A0K9P6C0_ZOSMR|nr:hypothetical protein ZOSMA_39G00010 [Zostera marina]
MATFSPCPFRITQLNLLHSSSSPSIGIRPTSQIPSSRCIVCSHRSPGVVLCDDDKYGKKEVISLTPKLYQYVLSNVREPDILRAVREETATMRGSQMQVSPEQAQFLSMLVQMLGANRCIELGVYTGYSSLAIALALPESGVIIACEKDGRFLEIAKKHWKQAGVCDKVIM